MTATSFLEVTLFVADVQRSAAFYRALGIVLFDNEIDGHPYHVDGGIGDTVLQLFPATRYRASSVALGFRVTNVAEVSDALTAAGFVFELPGRKRLRAYDPDGNRVHLSEIRAA